MLAPRLERLLGTKRLGTKRLGYEISGSPILGLLLVPSCVGTEFMEDMDDVGRMKKWRIGHCSGRVQ